MKLIFAVKILKHSIMKFHSKGAIKISKNTYLMDKLYVVPWLYLVVDITIWLDQPIYWIIVHLVSIYYWWNVLVLHYENVGEISKIWTLRWWVWFFFQCFFLCRSCQFYEQDQYFHLGMEVSLHNHSFFDSFQHEQNERKF